MNLERIQPDLVPDVGSPEPTVVSKDGQTVGIFHARRNGNGGWGIIDCWCVDLRFITSSYIQNRSTRAL
jgi:hypothetical protein